MKLTIDRVRMFLLYPAPGGAVAHIALNGHATMCGSWMLGAQLWDRLKRRRTPNRMCRKCLRALKAAPELEESQHRVLMPERKDAK